MMNSLKNFKLTKIFALALIFLVFSCSSDDPISEPTIAIANTNLTTSFFTEGEVETPTVQWNGDNGTFSLGSNITGTSIDANTGVISWDKSLPIGTNTIEIIATNSAGQTSINVIVENEFSGNFEGGYNSNPNSTEMNNDFEMNFNADGTMNVLDGGSSEGIGTWTASGDIITSVYSYNGGSSYFTVVTDLVYSETEADITGFWSSGETLADPASGYIKLSIEDQ
ncbi:hypothetical protein [Aureibaculum conchae]|uniref:hypothetical protein n=1 Tax=Aureibaculum sp. 2308TA14-22 TaxID=3108392 RepID=UPI003397D541